jgi:hypothetical protein
MTARKLVIAPRCIVCRHKDRALIEAAHVAGVSLDNVAQKHNISRDSVFRHMKNHLDDSARANYLAAIPMADLAAKAAEEGVSVLGFFSIIRATLMTQFQLAASLNDRHATATLAGRLTEVLRAIGSISGEMGSMAANNITINNHTVLNSPTFANIQISLLQALAPFPEARNAVVTALRAMDEAKAPPPLKMIAHIPSTESATQRVADVLPTINAG